jgi:hypothetical protein
MNIYTYKALTCKGEMTEGSVKGETEAAAIQSLRSMGLYPTQIRISNEPPTLRVNTPNPPAERQMITIGPKTIFWLGVTVGSIITYLCIYFS